MSEELLQKGYCRRGRVKGDPVGPYEGFNLGATTLDQLRKYHIVPDRSYGKLSTRKPDGIVVDRRGEVPIVKFVAEFKNQGGLDSAVKARDFSEKLANEYCRPLNCEFGGVSDSRRNSWLLVTPSDWRFILREDDYPLDSPIDFSGADGRTLLGKTLLRLESTLNKPKASLQPLESVNPTRLADQTWQDIWLACGEQPEACLATFIEILIFKFLSDTGALSLTPSGLPVDFETVITKSHDQILRYYHDMVRPEIKRIFPAGADGTSVINGIVLNPSAADQGRLFAQILDRFQAFGSLKRIDPEFKSRIFERFLKKSMSVKNWGQFFTPRNVVKAIVEMSGIEYLPPGSVVADPACGVGGFLLEPLMNKRPYDFRSQNARNLNYVGWDRDDKTIILAKANMLVHLSEALETDPSEALSYLPQTLNSTFQSNTGITGSLDHAPVEKFDLVMTNPPYVVRGTGRQRDFLGSHSDYYAIGGSGIENLFVQMVINGLRPGCRALIVVPDGLLLRHSEDALRKHILDTCDVEGVVSLPIDTFYSTPKKTYILILRKKQQPATRQRNPVFTYMVGNIGETLDAKRFVIAENDLPTMSSLFRLFQGNPVAFETTDPRCRVFPISKFAPEEHWLVNKWWPLEQREALGDTDAECFVNPTELAVMLLDASELLTRQSRLLHNVDASIDVARTATVSLSDKRYFRMSIGKRVLQRDLFNAERGAIPLYSANVEAGHEHGWISESNISDFTHPSLLWSIDSDFNMTVRPAGEAYATTDHCGRLEILDSSLDPAYCQSAIVYGYGRTFGFDRVTRPSLKRLSKVTLRVPVMADGRFDLESQQKLAAQFSAIQESVKLAGESLSSIVDLKPRAELPKDAIDMGPIAQEPHKDVDAAKRNQRDVSIAQQRLEEIANNPRALVSGAALKARLAKMMR